MKSRQYFKYDKYNEQRGAFEEAGYLLMLEDVTEYKRLVSEVDFTPMEAFMRLTGKDVSELKNIRLIQEWVVE